MIQIAKLCFCTTAVKKKPLHILKRLYPSNNVQGALLEQIEYLGGKIEMDGNLSCFLTLTLHSVASCFGSEYMATKQQR